MAELAMVAGVAVAGYLAITGVLYASQRSLLYMPDRSLPSPTVSRVPEMIEVTLEPEDRLALRAWYAPARAGQPTIIYFHGNGGHVGYRGSRVRPYLDRGMGVLLVGYRGYGGNPGRPTEAGLYQDARAALAFVSRSGIAPEWTILYGESLGSAVAVRIAGEQAKTGQPVAAVVLEAPLSSVTDVAAHHYPWAPVRWLLKDRFEAVMVIGGIMAPVLMVHGDADTVVPIRFAQALYAAAKEPKEAVWVPGGGHEDLDGFGLAQTVLQFIDEHVGAHQSDGSQPAAARARLNLSSGA
jgi:hypothetical protein